MTGDTFIDRADIQPEFWPSEWNSEPSKLFGALDAPSLIPSGSYVQYRIEAGMIFPCSKAMPRYPQ